MVTAEGDQLWFSLRSRRTSRPKLQKSLTHLLQRHGIIKRRDGYITTVNDGRPAGVGIDACAVVEAAEGGLAAGGLTDGTGAEARAFCFITIVSSQLKWFRLSKVGCGV